MYRIERLRDDPDARRRDARHRYDCVAIRMDCEEVCVVRVVMCGTEWQPIAPVITAIVCLSADVRSLNVDGCRNPQLSGADRIADGLLRLA